RLAHFLEKICGPLFHQKPPPFQGLPPGGVRPAPCRRKRILFIFAPGVHDSHAVTGNGITSTRFVLTEAKLTFCACAMLCSRRKWPYVFIANTPPSLCPSQRETVGMSTPD